MERMGQPIADAYQTVQNVVGNAMNVVFQLSSWFTDYETAPYTNIGGVRSASIGVSKRAVVKLFLIVTFTPVQASHWILRIVLANQRPLLPLVARNIQLVSLSKINLQRPFTNL